MHNKYYQLPQLATYTILFNTAHKYFGPIELQK